MVPTPSTVRRDGPVLLATEYQFLHRIVVEPCMEDLTNGQPLSMTIMWAYLLGLKHGQNMA